MPTAVESSPRHQAEQSDGDRQRVLIADEILDDVGPSHPDRYELLQRRLGLISHLHRQLHVCRLESHLLPTRSLFY